MNTTTRPNYTQPALIGGVVMGVLSALPIISIGNACCCLWVISGGLIATYLLQQSQARPVTPADGALVGLLAGLVGGVVWSLVQIPVDILVGPMEQAMVQRMLDAGTFPPGVRDAFDRYGRRSEMGGLFFIISRIFGLMFSVFVGGIFSTIGGLLGALIFRKQMPPGTIDVTPPA